MRRISRRSCLLAFAFRCNASQFQLPDVPVITHDGRRVGLQDLTAGQAVAVQFMFTSCTSICPLLGNLFAHVQRSLRTAAARNVLLISISVDPGNDSPSRLRAFLSKHKAEPWWIALRIEKPHLDALLRTVEEDAGSPAMHSPQVLIFDKSGKCVTRFRELATAERITDALLAASV